MVGAARTTRTGIPCEAHCGSMADGVERPTRHRGLLTFAVLLATSMQILDGTIVTIALANMQGNLSAARDTITWVLTSYMVASAIATPLTGWLAGRLGARTLVAGGLIGFTVTSVLCGLATSLPEMVAYRILQGIFGAPLIPMSQSILLDINPPSRHAKALSIWSASIMVFQSLGPTLGGWLTEYYNWRWCFLINLPLGIVALVIILTLMDKPRKISKNPFDFFGFTALALAVGALQLMLDRGAHKDWFSSTEIVLEAIIAGLGLWTFVVHSLTTKNPFFDPRLFRDGNFMTGVIVYFVSFTVYTGSMALQAPMLQQLYGYPVLAASILMLPRSGAMLVSMLVAGRLAAKVEPRALLVTGWLLMAWAMYGMSGFALHMGEWPLVWTAIVQGIGMSLLTVTVTVISFASLPPELRAAGASFSALLRGLGQSFGVSVTASLLATNTQISHADLTANLPSAAEIARQPFFGPFAFDPPRMAAVLDHFVNQQATMIAYINDYWAMAWLCIASLPVILLVRKRKAAAPAPAPVGE